jgi:virginiamycin A acetyltransferase
LITHVPVSNPSIQIGRHTYWGDDLVVKTWIPGERIVIGNYCSIGERVVICTGGMRHTDFAALYPFDLARAYKTTQTTTIGNDVWVGYGAMILGGAQIGDGAVIAAGAVVLSDVPAFAVAAGNPARVVRYRFSENAVARLLRIAWWNWPDEKVVANRDWFYKPISEFLEQFD